MSEESGEAKGIFIAIPKVMRDLSAVGKDKKASGFGSGYNYRGVDDLYNALHPLMARHGVFTTKVCRSENVTKFKSNKGAEGTHMVAVFEFTFWASDGSSVTTEAHGEAMDFGDKVAGKCASYAHKKALMEVFLVPTEDMEDPDKTIHEPIVAKDIPEKALDFDSAPSWQTMFVDFGKYKGSKLTSHSLEELESYVDYIEGRANAEGKQITGKVLDFCSAVEAWRASKESV